MITFGTDFTRHAARAGNVAAALARKLHDTLTVVHVMDDDEAATRLPDRLGSPSREKLEKEARRLRRLGPGTIRTELLPGRPEEGLVTTAASAGAGWVVVSAQGKNARERWRLGSVSERVAETSPVPTLVVRDDQSLMNWVGGRQTLRVLCAYDFTTSADAALCFAKELRLIGPCDIVVAQVDWPFSEKLRLGIAGPVPLGSNLPRVQEILERDLSERAEACLGKKNIRIRVEASLGRPDARLIEIARAEQTDLIITGTHQWRGLERLWHVSTSRGLLHHARMNVLVVPEAAQAPASISPTRRILVATDFSELGNRAILHAYAGLPAGGTVRLIHVIPPWNLPTQLISHYEPGPLSRKKHQQQMAESAKKLRALIPPEAPASGIATEVEVAPGNDVARTIGQAAERFGAQVVCVGSHGRSGLSRALLGSVAKGVLSQSRRPVLIIRAEPK